MSAAARHTPELPERYTRVLAALVQEYIEHGEPVSSLWLTARARLGVSSATIRHILAELESSGFVRQPHTSAGRVPTDLGYRCYVDLLMRRPRKGLAARDIVEARLRQAGTVDDVMANVSQELSRVSHHVGFALAPVGVAARLKHIDFVSIGGSKVLVVLITADGQICHKVIEAGDLVDDDELQRAANYLNGAFNGMPLSQVRLEIVSQLREERVLYDALMARALRLASSTLDDMPNQQLHIQGVASLLVEKIDEEHFSVATLRALFQLIEEKHRLVRLLSEYIEGEGLTVVIGSEHPTPDLQNFTLVASTYSDGTRSGTVGVIGPMRMRYSRTIAAVDGIASALNRILRQSDFDKGPSDDA